MNSILCNQGYIINKKDLSEKQLKEIRNSNFKHKKDSST